MVRNGVKNLHGSKTIPKSLKPIDITEIEMRPYSDLTGHSLYDINVPGYPDEK
jgi:hypothetical protein